MLFCKLVLAASINYMWTWRSY